jgi:hypothetical protein
MVEMAHGIRKDVPFSSVLQMITAGHAELVQYVYRSGNHVHWQWDDVGRCLVDHPNEELIQWFAMMYAIKGLSNWSVEAALCRATIMHGYDSLFKKLCLEYGYHTARGDVYSILAKKDNLSLAKWYRWRFPNSRFSPWVTIPCIIRFASLPFWVWIDEMFAVWEILNESTRAQIYEKWPEFRPKKRIKV